MVRRTRSCSPTPPSSRRSSLSTPPNPGANLEAIRLAVETTRNRFRNRQHRVGINPIAYANVFTGSCSDPARQAEVVAFHENLVAPLDPSAQAWPAHLVLSASDAHHKLHNKDGTPLPTSLRTLHLLALSPTPIGGPLPQHLRLAASTHTPCVPYPPNTLFIFTRYPSHLLDGRNPIRGQQG
jgi:hypothetical protein